MNYIGIDLGGTRIKIGLLENDTLIDSRILPAQSRHGLAAHLHLFDEVIEELLNDNSIEWVFGWKIAGAVYDWPTRFYQKKDYAKRIL
jgi:predicted NBD/HSP70 family sugar kinase